MGTRFIALVGAAWATLSLTSCGDDAVTPARDTAETDDTSMTVPPPGTVDDLPTATAGTGVTAEVTDVAPTGGVGVPEEPGPIQPGPSTTAPSAPGPAPQPPVAPAEGSGVVGVVTLGPQCAVMVVDTPCPDRAAAGARVLVHRRAAGSPVDRPTPDGPLITSTTADDDGGFIIELDAGDYVLSAESAMAMSCEPAGADVPRDGYATVPVVCDTGIR